MKARFMHNDRPVWRHEYKYRISRMTAEALSKIFLGLGLVRDPHADAKSGEYYVSSIYFDTPHLGDYYDKAGGFSLGKILSINESGDYPPQPYLGSFKKEALGVGSPVPTRPIIEPGSQEIIVNIDLVYEID